MATRAQLEALHDFHLAALWGFVKRLQDSGDLDALPADVRDGFAKRLSTLDEVWEAWEQAEPGY